MVCRIEHDVHLTDTEQEAGKQPSIVAVLARRESDLGELAADPRWKVPFQRPQRASGPTITRMSRRT